MSLLTDFSSEAIHPLLPRFVKGLVTSAFGSYALVQGLMALHAGLLAGWLCDRGPHGPASSFAVTGGLSLAACGLLTNIPPRR